MATPGQLLIKKLYYNENILTPLRWSPSVSRREALGLCLLKNKLDLSKQRVQEDALYLLKNESLLPSTDRKNDQKITITSPQVLPAGGPKSERRGTYLVTAHMTAAVHLANIAQKCTINMSDFQIYLN